MKKWGGFADLAGFRGKKSNFFTKGACKNQHSVVS